MAVLIIKYLGGYRADHEYKSHNGTHIIAKTVKVYVIVYEMVTVLYAHSQSVNEKVS